MNRYSTGTFTGQYKATIGADFLSKQVVVTDAFGVAHAVTLQIWDTAGQERFQSLGVGFYRGADGAILVYDITDAASLEHLQHWRNEFLQHVGGMAANNYMGSAPPFPFVVLGNKVDKEREHRRVPRQAAEAFCASGSNGNNPQNVAFGYSSSSSSPLTHLETSAKTAVNVEEAFQELARLALQYEDYKRRSQPQLFVPPATLPIDLRRDEGSFNDDMYHDGRRRKNDSCC
jgi:Ras-related protein Rab-7A